jgi:hypothetical protein
MQGARWRRPWRSDSGFIAAAIGAANGGTRKGQGDIRLFGSGLGDLGKHALSPDRNPTEPHPPRRRQPRPGRAGRRGGGITHQWLSVAPSRPLDRPTAGAATVPEPSNSHPRYWRTESTQQHAHACWKPRASHPIAPMTRPTSMLHSFGHSIFVWSMWPRWRMGAPMGRYHAHE